MRILFAHQNFPAQFRHLAPALAARGDKVVALTMNDRPPLPGVDVIRIKPAHGSAAKHPWAQHIEGVAIRAEAGLRGALALKDRGFAPDAIVAHPAWGEGLLLKEVWPDARLGLYCEHFLPEKTEPFDAEFEEADDRRAIRGSDKIKLLPQFAMMAMANAGLSPTHFQKSTFPANFRDRIEVIHDGIDVDAIRRAPDASITLGNGKMLTAADEVIVYIARQLEPARGFNIFMRALPELMAARPNGHFLIVGGDDVAYGRKPPEGQGNWREIFLREMGAGLDPARVHFVGQVAYPLFLNLLSIARLRIYLTHPTVLSWSVLEAMAAGCAILGSDVAPVREVVTDGITGMLFDYHDRAALIASACRLLDDHDARAAMTAHARQLIVDEYALKTVCLPRQFDWIDRLAAMAPLPPVMED